ncbi:hypothetical protein ACFQY7_33325 [Actinomadura luteofluorescens]|uniref:hypothetical protein n=1 Tax=Actinomadura luteofluorescens TaxID=46163 RepID=UPI0036259D41
MRHGKAAVLGLVVGAGTLGMAAPAMADPGDVIVKPAQARPGETVTVVGKKCQVDGTAGSLAFVGGAVPLNGAEEVDAGPVSRPSRRTPSPAPTRCWCGAARTRGPARSTSWTARRVRWRSPRRPAGGDGRRRRGGRRKHRPSCRGRGPAAGRDRRGRHYRPPPEWRESVTASLSGEC